MSRTIWLKKRFEALVAQGFGAWMEHLEDTELGTAVFCWNDGPIVRVFSNGISYQSKSTLRFRYDEIVELDLLDLRSLMKAQKSPNQSVEFSVRTISDRHVLSVPLFLYTTLSGVLNSIVGERVRADANLTQEGEA